MEHSWNKGGTRPEQRPPGPWLLRMLMVSDAIEVAGATDVSAAAGAAEEGAAPAAAAHAVAKTCCTCGTDGRDRGRLACSSCGTTFCCSCLAYEQGSAAPRMVTRLKDSAARALAAAAFVASFMLGTLVVWGTGRKQELVPAQLGACWWCRGGGPPPVPGLSKQRAVASQRLTKELVVAAANGAQVDALAGKLQGKDLPPKLAAYAARDAAKQLQDSSALGGAGGADAQHAATAQAGVGTLLALAERWEGQAPMQAMVSGAAPDIVGRAERHPDSESTLLSRSAACRSCTPLLAA